VATELEIQRGLTESFIAASPISLVLTPHARTKSNNGGYTTAGGTPRAAQSFKLIQFSENADPVLGQDGVMRRIDFMLLGLWDAQIAVDDQFTYDGGDFQVVALMTDLGYETRALVRRRG